jgi:hypothetical protein
MSEIVGKLDDSTFYPPRAEIMQMSGTWFRSENVSEVQRYIGLGQRVCMWNISVKVS